jgi:hypothetical protein
MEPFIELFIELLYKWWDVPPIITFSAGLSVGLIALVVVLWCNSCSNCEYYKKEGGV